MIEIEQGDKRKRNNKANGEQGHIAAYDILRILSAVAVVLIHISADFQFRMIKNGDFTLLFYFVSLLNAFGRFAVPMFFMLSGILFIGKETLETKMIWHKYIKNIVYTYICWTLITNTTVIIAKMILEKKEFDIKSILTRTISIPYHLWFLPALITGYALLPLLRKIAIDKNLLRYFSVFFIATSIVGSISSFFTETLLIKSIGVFLNEFANSGISTAAAYMLFGYCLSIACSEGNSKTLKFINKHAITIFGITILIHSYLLYLTCVIQNAKVEWANGNMSIFTVIETVALYLFITNRYHSTLSSKRIRFFSSLTLGIYVLHGVIFLNAIWVIREKLPEYYYTGYASLLFIPVSVILVVAICSATTILIKKIPILKKLI